MQIEFSTQVQFGEAEINEINVLPLNFISFADIWRKTADEVRGTEKSATSVMQRRRIVFQAQFMSAGKRVAPDASHISQLPIPVVKAIIKALDVGEGVAGELLNDADGISAPIHYKLGTPIEMTSSGKKVQIAELEFQAKVYGDIEDVLAADGDVPQALALIQRVATPVGGDMSLRSLPTWALERMTVADGVTIMRSVLPRFLE